MPARRVALTRGARREHDPENRLTTSSTQSPTGAADAIPYGFNVVAHASGNLGLAVAARNTIQALIARRDALCVVDVDAGGGRSGHDLTYAHLECKTSPPPFAVNLLHMNPPDIVNLMIDDRLAFSAADRLNVAVPFWELPRLPEAEWTPLLERCRPGARTHAAHQGERRGLVPGCARDPLPAGRLPARRSAARTALAGASPATRSCS